MGFNNSLLELEHALFEYELCHANREMFHSNRHQGHFNSKAKVVAVTQFYRLMKKYTFD